MRTPVSVSPAVETAPPDNPGRAAALMVFALFLLGFQDSLVKLTSSEISLWQMQTIRATGNLTLLILISFFLFRTAVPKPQRLWAVTLRSLLLVGTMVLFFGGVPVLSLSEIAAGLYVFPLFVAVLSVIILGERIGPRRVLVIAAGFCGTILILKPGTDGFKWISLLPVGAGFCYALMLVTTRKLCRNEHPVTLAFGVGIAFILVGIIGLAAITVFPPAPDLAAAWPYLLTAWRPLEWWVLGVVVATSFINLTANVSLSRAYQTAESSWLAPFDYSYLIFATFWGCAMWGHVPDALSFAGMGLIAGAGIYVAWREQQLAKRAAAQAASASD